MKNVDRAKAYARQRGVEIPDYSKLTVQQLQYRLQNEYGYRRFVTGVRKQELLDKLTIHTLMPQLTTGQQRRLKTHLNDDQSRRLRDRKQKKLAEFLKRRLRTS